MTPLLSVLIAVYNVEEFVSATLKSFDRQDCDQSLVEYIFIDDGSTDSSKGIIDEWAAQRQNVTILSQENQGAGSARKAGLEVVKGKWVTVVDPDDILSRNYFSSIFEFMRRDSRDAADMLVTKVLVLNGETGRAYDTHPLGYRFKKGSRLVSLLDEPTCIQLGATAVLRTARLREHGLTYDPRIEPTFEDAHLLGRYLATSPNPVIGLVADSKYYYRKRTDQSSLVQSSWAIESRYSTVLELGYLDMLESIKSKTGSVPVWAQNMVLYDLVWYLKEETKQHSKTAWVSGELRDQFLHLLMRIFDLIEVSTIENFSINPMWWSMRQTVLGFFKRTYAFGNRVIQWGPDKTDGSNKYCILSFGAEPTIELFADGLATEPVNDNYTVHSYFGIPMMTERNFTIGVPGKVVILVDGRKALIERAQTKVNPPALVSSKFVLDPLEQDQKVNTWSVDKLSRRVPALDGFVSLQKKAYSKFNYVTTRLEVEGLALSEPLSKVVVKASKKTFEKIQRNSAEKKERDNATRLIEQSKSTKVRSRFHNAWVVMDRPMRADDNGEHFYRYLMKNRSDINAFYLLSRSSPDWDRLDAEGFRLIEYGSDESVLLLLNADFRLSSDAVAEVMYPISRKNFDLSHSKFIFLQHGVTKDDLSRWLNPKRLDGIVCATVDEYESIAGSKSPYTIKRSQTLLTGFPRFDRLHELASMRSSEPDLILVMPTWRQYLRDELVSCNNDQDKVRIFNESDFGKNWIELLNHSGLKELAFRQKKKIGFIAHPAFSSLIEYLQIPDHVEILDPATHGFQNLLIRSCLFITDYSSVAFDAANIRVPVMYFQFDPHVMFGGGHNFRKGYFDYVKDGFGPVDSSAEDIVQHAIEFLESKDKDSLSQYQTRAERAFPFSDSKNSERLTEALFSL